MRRAEFSKLTGLTPAFLNSLARRDQFPFLRSRSVKRGWGNYAIKHAYMTVLALGLADAGATQEAAGHFVENEFARLKDSRLHLAERSTSDTYLGYARLVSAELEPATGGDAIWTVLWPLCGGLKEVLEAVLRLQVRPGEPGLHSVVLVNASEHLRELTKRAAEQGISPSEFEGESLFEATRP
jgi:hypothetical protein